MLIRKSILINSLVYRFSHFSHASSWHSSIIILLAFVIGNCTCASKYCMWKAHYFVLFSLTTGNDSMRGKYWMCNILFLISLNLQLLNNVKKIVNWINKNKSLFISPSFTQLPNSILQWFFIFITARGFTLYKRNYMYRYTPNRRLQHYTA